MKKLFKYLLPGVWKKSRRYSEIIRKRGPEKYADYTPEFIFDSVLQAYKQTFRMIWPKFWRLHRLRKVPKIYFDQQIEPIIAKFTIYRTEFDKIPRNDRIRVRDKKNGWELTIKKKFFDPQLHEYLGKLEKHERETV